MVKQIVATAIVLLILIGCQGIDGKEGIAIKRSKDFYIETMIILEIKNVKENGYILFL